MNYIIRELSVIRYEITSKNLLNLTDDNIYMQNFMRDLLNLTFGYNLVNLNDKSPNFPGIDLGDEARGIGFQITSTKTGQKIKDTLDICIKSECCHAFPQLKFFILTEKQSTYSIDYQNSVFCFAPQNDIIDFDDLFVYILSNLDNVRRRKICEYIQQEVPNVLSAVGVDYFCQSDFKRIEKEVTPEDWIVSDNGGHKYYTLRILHGFGFRPSNATLLVNNTNVLAPITITDTYVEIGSAGTSCLNATIIITS